MNQNDHDTSFHSAVNSTNGSTVNRPEIDLTATKGEVRKNSRLALYLAFLALFFTALGITVGYKHWLRIHDKAKIALTEITVLNEQILHTASNSEVEKLQASLSYSRNEAEQRLTSAIEELDQIRKQTTYSASTVARQIRELTLLQAYTLPSNIDGSDITNLTLQTEVRFLLESAQRSLHINNDKISSLQQLKAADQLLIQTASDKFLPVREKLAQDITRLEPLSLPNIEELSQLISQLETNITPLSVPKTTMGTDTKTSLETNLSDKKNIDLFTIDDKSSLTGKIKGYLNNSVTISKQTELPRYQLSLIDKQRTDQLLKLRLESLRLMLLKQHNTTYHQQINRIKQMLDLYYIPVETKPWLVTLDKLSQHNLTPSYPDITTALKQLIQISGPVEKESTTLSTDPKTKNAVATVKDKDKE